LEGGFKGVNRSHAEFLVKLFVENFELKTFIEENKKAFLQTLFIPQTPFAFKTRGV
jgi:hypothetical protein